jgi:hypothetical protein
MAMYTAITYIGKTPGFIARVGKRTYEFEWQKSLGIGRRPEEVDFVHAVRLSKRRDRNGKKMLVLE